MVVVFGGIVLADGALAASRGHVDVAGPGLVLGLLLAVAGVLLLQRRRVLLATMALCALVAVDMLLRVHRSGQALPGVAVGVLAVVLVYQLLAERRRIEHRRAEKPPDR